MNTTTKTQTLAYTRGIPGSGKSTFAVDWLAADPDNRVRVNRDDIRQELFGVDMVLDANGRPDGKAEGQVTEHEEKLIVQALRAGKDVLVDATHLGGTRLFKRMATLHARGLKWNKDLVLTHYDFPVDLAEALKRNAARDRVVPEKVIRNMFNGLGPNGEFLLVPGTHPVQAFQKPASRTKAVIFDMDGTMTDVRSIRHYVERKPGDKRHRNFDLFHFKSEFCPPNQAVLDLYEKCIEAGLTVLITTARNERYREVTQKWLDEHGVKFENMFMRADKDSRPDYVVKDEILNTQILPLYDVVHCFDDNPQAVQAWVDNGLTVTTVPFINWENVAEFEGRELPVDDLFLAGICLRCGKPSDEVLHGKCAVVREAP